MRWTDEVHVSRTLNARRDARKLYRGTVPQPKGHAKTVPLLAALGALAVLASCESAGRFRVSRLPVVGPWLGSKLRLLRRHLFWRGRLPSLPEGRPPPRSAAGEAAMRRQVQSEGATHSQAGPSEAQATAAASSSSHSKRQSGGKKKGKGGSRKR